MCTVSNCQTVEHGALRSQYCLSGFSIVVGTFLLISGIFAYLAIKGGLPPNATKLHSFGVVGLDNSYFMIAGGAVLTLLAIAALLNVFRKHGSANRGEHQ
ncbi:MAG: hypothetical protein H7A36_04370 [Chlamydiales bacterium]|nr:hypothetical protein [Chlamydiales bacterium]